MARGQGGARRPATKFAHLQKKMARQKVSQGAAAFLLPKTGNPPMPPKKTPGQGS